MPRAAALILLALTTPSAAQFDLNIAAPSGSGSQPVHASHALSATGVQPGGEITLAIVLDISPPYHVNAHQPDDPTLIPTTVQLTDIPDKVRAGTPIYPDPHRIPFGPANAPKQILVYSDRAIIYVPLAVTGSVSPGELTLGVRVGWQACDDTKCLMPSGRDLAVALTIVDAAQEIRATNAELFAAMPEVAEQLAIPLFGWDFRIDPNVTWLLLLVAGVGGFLLNLTPCVLPVIPIKIMGLSQAAGSRRRSLLLGLSMSAGVIVFWLALAEAISQIRGFETTNALMQRPAFTVSVGLVIAIMSVGMMGLFAMRLPKAVYAINPSQDTFVGSFGFGVMTAILSTPCTAPFMGAAAAWATTQDPMLTRATFGAIGLGMAAPYLVLSAFPALVHRMPRTGPASELIKQVMGLLMLAAAAYFAGTGLAGWTATPPDPPSRLYWWSVALFIAMAGGWLGFRTLRLAPAIGRRIVFVGMGVALVAVAVTLGVRLTDRGPINWTYYTPERLQQASASQKVIVLEFTAEWCLNCHALEQAVLRQPAVVELLNRPDVAAIKVDITGNNEDGDRKLVEVGRRSIPYLVIYDPAGRRVFSSDAYTVEQVTRAMQKAFGSTSGP